MMAVMIKRISTTYPNINQNKQFINFIFKHVNKNHKCSSSSSISIKSSSHVFFSKNNDTATRCISFPKLTSSCVPTTTNTTVNKRNYHTTTTTTIQKQNYSYNDPYVEQTINNTNTTIHEHTPDTNNTEPIDNNSINNTNNRKEGEMIYKKATEKINEMKEVKNKMQETKILEQYNALTTTPIPTRNNQTNNNANNDRRSSLAVIRTIVRQAREEAGKSTKRRSGKTSSAIKNKKIQEEETIQRIKKDVIHLLEQSALDYHYPKALIHLGDLQLEQEDEEELSSTTITSNTSLFLPTYTIQEDKCPDLTNDPLYKTNTIYKAACFYEMAGYYGSGWGYFLLGMLLWDGHHSSNHNKDDMTTTVFPSNIEMSLKAIQKAVALKEPNAMYFLGTYLIDNFPASVENQRQGLSYIEQASAKNQHSGALYYLTLYYYNGNTLLDVPGCSTQEYTIRLDTACDAGSAEALFLRGHGYLKGIDGYTQDPNKALNDFALAAREYHHADAAISAGAILHHGIKDDANIVCIHPRKSEAFELYQMAAVDLNSLEGWRNVADCYRNGDGVGVNLSMADYIQTNILDKNDPPTQS